MKNTGIYLEILKYKLRTTNYVIGIWKNKVELFNKYLKNSEKENTPYELRTTNY